MHGRSGYEILGTAFAQGGSMTAFGPLLPLSRGSRSSGLQPGGSLRQRGRILAPIHVSGVHASGDPGTGQVIGGEGL